MRNVAHLVNNSLALVPDVKQPDTHVVADGDIKAEIHCGVFCQPLPMKLLPGDG